MSRQIIKIYTDGGARGNPGPAAAGVVFFANKEGRDFRLISFGVYLGETTNNVAEYRAVIEALRWLKNHPEVRKNYPTVEFYLDSLLVASQLNGTYRVKDFRLRELLFTVRLLEQENKIFPTYKHIPRKENHLADFEVNKILDQMIKSKGKEPLLLGKITS